MKAVVYGNGYWANILMRYIKSNSVEIIGIIDIDTGKIEEDELLDIADIAFICTPVKTHYSIVRKLLNMGLHVFCEKILTDNKHNTQELVDLAKRSELILFTDYTYLYSPSINFIKENIELIGTLKLMKGTIKQYGKFYNDCNVLENIGVHLISAFHYISGLGVFSTNSYQINNNLDNYDYKYIGKSRDVDIFITCSLLSNIKTREIEFIGNKGILTYSMLSKDTVIFTNYINSDENFTKQFDENNNLDFAVKDFLSSINKKIVSGSNQKITLLVSNDLDRISLNGGGKWKKN